MIHVLTAHFRTSRWIPPQHACLDAYIAEPHRVLCSVEGFDAEKVRRLPARHWSVIEQSGEHAEKLNELARLAIAEADARDVLLFLDGDALPVGDLSHVFQVCRDGGLVAVRRDENLGDPQPHPSFCAARVDFWRALPGDWSPGPKWVNSAGRSVTDVGARTWTNLRARGLTWTPLLRTCTHALHKVWFGVYGDLVYHHGAGFRFPVCRHDFVASEAYADSLDVQGARCHERGLASKRLGTEILARIEVDPLRTLQRCKDGSLFEGLRGSA